MKRVLYLTGVIVATSHAQVCNNTFTQYSHFNLIASNAGRTDGGVMIIDGPALIFNDYYLDNAVINQKEILACGSVPGTELAIDELGLWLGNTGTAQQATNTTVYSGTITDYDDGDFIKRIDDGCRVIHNRLAYVPDESILDNGLLVSNELATLMPTHYINQDAEIVEVVNSTTTEYYVFNFAKCESLQTCKYVNADNATSDPRGLLFGDSEWSGPTPAWPSDKQVVLNIPVDSNSALSITGTHDLMSNGLIGCNTIWNFYSTSNTSTFDLTFSNSNPIGGLFLAPQGKIKNTQGDENILYGQVFANTYTPNSDGESRLGNYYAFGDTCNQTFSCWPGFTKSNSTIYDQGKLYGLVEYETTTSHATSYFTVYTTDDFDTRTGTTLTKLYTKTITSTYISSVTASVYELTVVPTTVTVTEYVDTEVDTVYDTTTTSTALVTYTQTQYNDITSTVIVPRMGTRLTTLTEQDVATATVTITSMLRPATIYTTETRTKFVHPRD